jgi:glycerate kinase
VGIGGSATNDGGMGAMMALGVRYYDNTGALLDGCGSSLHKIQSIDVSNLHPGMREASFTIFCDVDNPLYGPQGAAHVFGPQKGASPAMIEVLDLGLRHYEMVLQRYGYLKTRFAGVGAGGGFPLSLAVFSHAVIRSGIEFIMDFVGLEQQIRDADIVITGEGKLDEQTLSGKVVKGVASLAARHSKPVVVVAGSSSLSDVGIRSLGVHHLISLVNGQTSTEEAILHARDLIRKRVQENYLSIAGDR